MSALAGLSRHSDANLDYNFNISPSLHERSQATKNYLGLPGSKYVGFLRFLVLVREGDMGSSVLTGVFDAAAGDFLGAGEVFFLVALEAGVDALGSLLGVEEPPAARVDKPAVAASSKLSSSGVSNIDTAPMVKSITITYITKVFTVEGSKVIPNITSGVPAIFFSVQSCFS
jgi:hypothetical protein